MKPLPFLLALAASGAAAQTNPFFQASALPFQAPPFDKIKDSDYQPAIEEGMKREIVEIEAIADRSDPPTFENTVVTMERSGDLLRRVLKVFYALTQANTDDTLQKVEEEESPRLAAHRDAIYLNAKLYARVKAVYDHREALKADAEASYLVERYHRDFVLAGAELSDADKASLRALNQEEATLTTEYRKHVLADTDSSAVVVNDKGDLAGLSESDVAAAAQQARDRKLEGKYVLTLQNTTGQPALASLDNRALRQRLFEASSQRCDHGGPNDNRALIERLAQLRAQKAKLLGFPNYAAYALDDQMAKTPENAIKLMTDMVPATVAKAKEQAASMEKMAGAPLAPWDWQFYAERLRKKEYALDEAEAKPYLELDRVLHEGVFFAANRLYGVTFKERHDLPVYDPDVRVFDVLDADGKPLALWYADYYARANKSGGAWMDTFVDQSDLLGTKPVVYNVCNFTKPAPGQPALLSFTDVIAMFHEFGHALHGMFSNVKYPTLTGTSVPRDFVEFPSQFNEHWALEPTVIARYARHYKTGEPMPQALVDRIKASRKFNQGYALGEYLESALLDIAWHTLPADTPPQKVNDFEPKALERFGIAMPLIPPRYHTTYFSHIWGGGYSAGYYAYLWSELIDDDAFYWFEEHGGMTRENGQRFRDMVLSRGGSEEPAAMYRAFRGRDPVVGPLLIERGLKEAPKK